MIRLFISLVATLFVLVPAAVQAQGQAQVPAQPPVFSSSRIIVETRGSGPDIIFVPGLGSTGAAWRSTADRLDDRYRVHLVTLRGFCETDIGDNVGGGLAGPAASEIERYIREQRIDRPAVIGH